MSIGIIIPTLGRSGVLQRVAENADLATKHEHTIVFIVEPDDEASRDAAVATGQLTLVNAHERSYAGAFQTAYEATDDEFFVMGNDDFDFQDGWDIPALEAMTDADVVGINDGGSGCNAIMLIRRSYIESESGVIDMPNRVLYPYQHNYCDTELRETAIARGRFVACPESVIVHMHPDFGKAEMDEVYAKSRATFGADAETFRSRSFLWENLGRS
jgi:hypothetical protein